MIHRFNMSASTKMRVGGLGEMKARVHGYPQHYHIEAHLHIGVGRE
jgi:hypothetical protein